MREYVTLRGKSMIEVKLIAHSVSAVNDQEMITFELTYPRIIHSEMMTHRLFSRNAMSSRAIPIAKMIEEIRRSPAMPVRFGANQSGMQDKGGEHDGKVLYDWVEDEYGMYQELYCTGREAWAMAAEDACLWAERFEAAGYHKQIANRLLEPFQMMKAIFTATDMNNFFWLRVAEDADPTIKELAGLMREAWSQSMAEVLQPGQWHTPYVEHWTDEDGGFGYMIENTDNDDPAPYKLLTEDEALAISSSCCAQVSYRILDATYEKAMRVYGRLLTGDKVHASPFEHQGTPIKLQREIETSDGDTIGFVNRPDRADSWEKGITHVDRDGFLWSGNLCGFIQHRQLLDNHVKIG